jgi:hypothetical protein
MIKHSLEDRRGREHRQSGQGRKPAAITNSPRVVSVFHFTIPLSPLVLFLGAKVSHHNEFAFIHLGVVSVFHLSIFAPCFSFHAKSAKKREEKIIVIPTWFGIPQ